MARDDARQAMLHALLERRVAIVLEPLARPELGAIHVDDAVFAVGRAESPFSAYPPETVADLSRRHARIFVEAGAAYLAELGSKNGTNVNGMPVRQAIVPLRDGDEIGFGRALSYRVHMAAVDSGPAPPARLAGLTLQPEPGDAGLEPIVITRFPFLVSKVDETFARYRNAQPHQVAYLSRRHAHLFLKGGRPYVEDLGSTNGTWIGAARLDEHAHELRDGDVLAFGGRHFAYRVSLQWEPATQPGPTVTGREAPPAQPAQADRTTFVAAADSFLDIFCVDRAAAPEDEVNHAAGASKTADGGDGGARSLPRGKFTRFATGLLEALGAGGDGDADLAGLRRWVLALGAFAAVIAFTLYSLGAPERELRRLMTSGDYQMAAVLANDRLARDPHDAQIRAQGAEALLKAELPQWIAFIGTGRFDRATAAVARMRALGRHNTDLTPLIDEIEWLGRLEQFVAARGGAAAPASGAADQAHIRLILKPWQDDPQAHQRAFATISAFVPAFRDTYAHALSDLRKLALIGGGNGND